MSFSATWPFSSMKKLKTAETAKAGTTNPKKTSELLAILSHRGTP